MIWFLHILRRSFASARGMRYSNSLRINAPIDLTVRYDRVPAIRTLTSGVYDRYPWVIFCPLFRNRFGTHVMRNFLSISRNTAKCMNVCVRVKALCQYGPKIAPVHPRSATYQSMITIDIFHLTRYYFFLQWYIIEEVHDAHVAMHYLWLYLRSAVGRS